MLVLFETAAGYALFKVLDESKIEEADNVWKEFETPEKANKALVEIIKKLIFICRSILSLINCLTKR